MTSGALSWRTHHGSAPPLRARRAVTAPLGPRIAVMSMLSVFAVLLIVGVAALGIAALVALVLLLIRGRSVES